MNTYRKGGEGGTCGFSRRCTCGRSSADGRSVAETTMRTREVVVVEPGRKLLVAFFRRGVMTGVGPFAQGRLDEAFRLAVGARRIRSGEAVADSELRARRSD